MEGQPAVVFGTRMVMAVLPGVPTAFAANLCGWFHAPRGLRPGEADEGMPGDCVFCEIVARRAAASILAENEGALAFLSTAPFRPGHALIVPKRHFVELVDGAPAEVEAVARLALEVARRQRERLGSRGETLFLASGRPGEQSVLHSHLHVVPRAEGDGLGLTAGWDTKARTASRAELDSLASRMRP